VLGGLRGEENISGLCRREGIAASMYYGWSKEFLEAGEQRLAGDTARADDQPIGIIADDRRIHAIVEDLAGCAAKGFQRGNTEA
jgi:transposase